MSNDKYLLSMNFITQGNKVLNKNQIPIILYTENAKKAINDIYNNETYIGGSIFDFCNSNILSKTVLKNEPDIYSTSYLKYIYYNKDIEQSETGEISVQDIIPLKYHNKNSTKEHNIYITQLYYYYIYKTLIYIYSTINTHTVETIYDYDNAEIYINNIMRKLINDYKLTIISIIKKVKQTLKYTYKLSDNNINELMLFFEP